MFDLEDAKKRGCLTTKGAKVRILCDDRKDSHPVVGLYEVNGEEGVLCARRDGTSPGGWHLVNLPLEREVWVAACAGNYIAYHDERGASDMAKCWRAQGAPSGYAKVTIPLTK